MPGRRTLARCLCAAEARGGRCDTADWQATLDSGVKSHDLHKLKYTCAGAVVELWSVI